MKKYIYRIYALFAKLAIYPILKKDYEINLANQNLPNERVVEYSFALNSLNNYNIKNILDVGSGLSPFPKLLEVCDFTVVSIDNMRDYWSIFDFNRHTYVCNHDIVDSPFKENYFDAITCISVLEHIDNYVEALKNMVLSLRSDGVLVLTFPYNENNSFEDAYVLEECSYNVDVNYRCRIFSRNDVNYWCDLLGLRIVNEKFWTVCDGELHAQGKFIWPIVERSTDENIQLACFKIQKL